MLLRRDLEAIYCHLTRIQLCRDEALLHLEKFCKPCLNDSVRSALCDLLKWLIGPALKPMLRRLPTQARKESLNTGTLSCSSITVDSFRGDLAGQWKVIRHRFGNQYTTGWCRFTDCCCCPGPGPEPRPRGPGPLTFFFFLLSPGTLAFLKRI